MAETPVTKPVRTSIKVAAKVAQVARLIELMPTPQDFANRLAADIIYMSSLIQQFVKDINKVLDGYSNIPWDYLNNQLYSIADSANNTLNRAQEYTNYIINNTLGTANSVVAVGAELYETVVDFGSHTAHTASSFGAAVASTSADIKGDHEVAQRIRDGVGEWSSNASNSNPLRDAMGAITNAQNNLLGITDDIFGAVGDTVNAPIKLVQTIVNKLKGMVDKMSKDIDAAFGGIIQTDKITNTLTTVNNGLTGYDKAVASQVVGASAGAINAIIENFSVGKFVSAFLGVTTNAVLIKTGLNELPPINFDKMLYEFQGSLEDPLKGLTSDVTYDDLVNYNAEKYNALKESFEEELKKQREEILNKKKNIFTAKTAETKAYLNASKNIYSNMSKEERKEIKTAIKEIKKKRDTTKKAKVSKKLKDIVLEELDKLKEECNRFAKRLKEEWEAMLQTYKDAVQQITSFFTGDGPGDKYIEALCLDINKNCDDIKQLCTIDMPTQIAGSSTKAALPYCFGMAVPNYAHNLISFVVDLKIILKFIMDLITYVMNILIDIKLLAQLFLNGLKKLRDIMNQLLDMLGLKWFMNLVQDIVDLYKKKAEEACELLEGTLSPVYLKDTSMYHEWKSEITTFMNRINGSSSDSTDLKIHLENSHINGLLVMMGADPIDYEIGDSRTGYRFLRTINVGGIFDGFITTADDFRTTKRTVIGQNSNGVTQAFPNVYRYNTTEIAKELKAKIAFIESIKDTYIVAYRSPKFKSNVNASHLEMGDYNVRCNYDPSQITTWYYYHPNLNHLGYDIKFKNLYGKEFNYQNFTFNNLINSSNKNTIEYYRDYYSTYMENAARVANNEWQHKTIKKASGNWGDAFNIVKDGNITAYEIFYWYQDVVDGEENWTRVLLPNGDYDGYYDIENPHKYDYSGAIDGIGGDSEPIIDVDFNDDYLYIDYDYDYGQVNIHLYDMDNGVNNFFINNSDLSLNRNQKLAISFQIYGVDWNTSSSTPMGYIDNQHLGSDENADEINKYGETTFYLNNDSDSFIPLTGLDYLNIVLKITPDMINAPFNDDGEIDMSKIQIKITDVKIITEEDSDDSDSGSSNIGGSDSGSSSGNSNIGGSDSDDNSDDSDDIDDYIDYSKGIIVKLNVNTSNGTNVGGKIKLTADNHEYSKEFNAVGKKMSQSQAWNEVSTDIDTFALLVTGNNTSNIDTPYSNVTWSMTNATFDGESYGTFDGNLIYLNECVVIEKNKPVIISVNINFTKSQISDSSDNTGGNASIINQSEKGSVVRIYINNVDSDGNLISKESKLVWVKNKFLKKGDWISVKINGTIKYFQVF